MNRRSCSRICTRRISCSVALAALLLAAAPAAAHPVDGRRFGLGLEIGQPSALTAYVSLSQVSAIDLAVGFPTFDARHDLYVHLDYLVLPVDLARGGSLSVPLYLGIGGWITHHHGGYDISPDMVYGARFPLGIALDY